MTNLLMVCMGNVCRSPMAKAVACKFSQDAGLAQQLMFDSAGTHADRIGERLDPRAELALSRRGYAPAPARSRKIGLSDFELFDLILAMDALNLSDLRRICPPRHAHKLRLFLECADDLAESEIPDPYYGSAQGFERVLDLCEAGAKGLLKRYTM